MPSHDQATRILPYHDGITILRVCSFLGVAVLGGSARSISHLHWPTNFWANAVGEIASRYKVSTYKKSGDEVGAKLIERT
jgi:hypothetical protein